MQGGLGTNVVEGIGYEGQGSGVEAGYEEKDCQRYETVAWWVKRTGDLGDEKTK